MFPISQILPSSKAQDDVSAGFWGIMAAGIYKILSGGGGGVGKSSGTIRISVPRITWKLVLPLFQTLGSDRSPCQHQLWRPWEYRRIRQPSRLGWPLTKTLIVSAVGMLELSPIDTLGLSPFPKYNPDVRTVCRTLYGRQTFQRTTEHLAKLHATDNLT